MSGLAIIGCKSTTRYLYQSLRDSFDIRAIVTLTPETADRQQVVDYDDLDDLGAEVEIHRVKRYNLSDPDDQAFFAARGFAAGLAIGWQRLIPPPVLDQFGCGVFGMHGSSQDLPYGRGRSPMNWSIIEGRRWFTTNLFRYSSGADDGPIAATSSFSIQPADTGETLHFKNLLAMVDLARSALPAILDGQIALRAQAVGEPTYYPKRDPADSIIDWEADLFALDRHIRAVAPPFGGAFTFLGEARVTIDRAAIFYTDVEAHPFRRELPGTIVAVLPNGKFCVRCVGGVLLVHEARIEGAVSPMAGATLESPRTLIKAFPRNRHGHFDLPE